MSWTFCSASTGPDVWPEFLQPYMSTAATKLATKCETQCHTTIRVTRQMLVCPSLACNSLTDQSNTTGQDTDVHHIKTTKTKRTLGPNAPPVRARASPNQISNRSTRLPLHTLPKACHNTYIVNFPSACTCLCQTLRIAHKPVMTSNR